MAADGRARILIVDDDPAQLHALCDALDVSGYASRGFAAPGAALRALRDEPFDLLLTDLNMPGGDGISLLREALRIDPGIVGIVMTGEGTIDTAIGAMKSGAFDYVLKPFRLSAMLAVLARALKMRRLHEQNAALEGQVLAHTADLEVANRELDAYAHSVSHDLRAPLRGIAGIAGILEEDFGQALGGAGLRLVGAIRSNCERMTRLIEDLLSFSRLSRQPLDTRPVAMNDLVSEVLAELRSGCENRSIRFSIADLGVVQADPALLKQVLVNLLGNAIKYTGRRDEASVQVGLSTDAGGAPVYFVRDNGAGFDMRHAGRLFTAFARLHRPDEFDGTGVGLAIVQRIIQRHGGNVWAEGAVGQGATFFFRLPEAAA